MTLKTILFISTCQLAGPILAQAGKGLQFNQRGELEILPLLVAAKSHAVSKIATDGKVQDKEILKIANHEYEWPIESVLISDERLIFLTSPPPKGTPGSSLPSSYPLFFSKPPKWEEVIACSTTNELISLLLKGLQDIPAEKKFLKQVLALDWLDMPELLPPNTGSVIVRACYLFENRIIGVQFRAFSDRNGIKDGNSVLRRQSCQIWASAPIDH
jgi:hypothetical protein